MNKTDITINLCSYEELNGELPIYSQDEWINQYSLHPMSFANLQGEIE